VNAYTSDGNLGYVLVVLLVFGLSVIPFIYLLQTPFTSPATGFVVLIILAIVSGKLHGVGLGRVVREVR
jgi:hypothetical protein